MKQNLLLILALAITLTGCGSKSDSNSSSTSEVQTFINLEELKAALDEQNVVCGEAGLACPSYAAKLAFWGKSDNKRGYYLAVCSGSLYNGKYIITNSHCIPKEIATAGAACTDQIKVLFPTTKYNDAESAKCKRIVQVYNPALEQPDIAVIELENASIRDSVEIQKDSFVEGSNVYAFTMSPDKFDHNKGTISKKACTLSSDNAYETNNSTSSPTTTISGYGCDVIGGNSGSGLLKNGKMIGVVFARFEVPELEKSLQKNGINYSGKGFLGLAQNISCLNEITASAGFNCNMSPSRASDFELFVERAKAEHNLAAVSDSQIEYEMTLNFKLKLKEVINPQSGKSLADFRTTWTKIFYENASETRSSKVFKRFLRK